MNICLFDFNIIFKISGLEINHIVIFFYDNTCHPMLYMKHQCIYNTMYNKTVFQMPLTAITYNSSN